MRGFHFKALTECSSYSRKEFYLFLYFSFYYASVLFLFFHYSFFRFFFAHQFWKGEEYILSAIFFVILFYFTFTFALFYMYTYLCMYFFFVSGLGFLFGIYFCLFIIIFISICDIKNIDIHMLISVCPYITYRCKV